MDGIEVPYAIIKGEPLSYYAFGKFAQRRSTDIDILVSRKNRDVVRDEFIKHGFRMKEKSRAEIIQANLYSHQMIPLTKPSIYEEINVDINYDIFWGEYTGERVDIDEFLSDTSNLDIYGNTFRVLPHMKALVQLILHHYKEMNSIFHLMTHDSVSEKMFDDIYYFITSRKDIFTPEAIVRVMQEYKITAYAYYMFFYTAKVHPDERIILITDQLYNEEAACLLNRYGLSKEEYGEWDVPFEKRLKCPDLSQYIKNNLNDKSLEKLNNNIAIFA